MPNEVMGPSYERIRQMTNDWRNTQRFQNRMRNDSWSEFLVWLNNGHTSPAPAILWGVLEWYQDFYDTISDQGYTIPVTAPHFINFAETSENYTDVYYPSDGMNEMNVIVRFYNDDIFPPDAEIDN